MVARGRQHGGQHGGQHGAQVVPTKLSGISPDTSAVKKM